MYAKFIILQVVEVRGAVFVAVGIIIGHLYRQWYLSHILQWYINLLRVVVYGIYE